MEIFSAVIEIMNRSQKSYALKLMLLVLVMALFEVAGVATIMPFMALLANPGIVEQNIYLKYLYDLFAANSPNQFIFYVGICIFLILVTSLSLKALTSFMQQRFALMLEYQISVRLVRGYIHNDYKWFLDRNSADLGKTILSETGTVIGSGILPFINLVTNTIVVVFLIILLFAVDSQTTAIVAGIFILFYGSIYILTRSFLSKLGADRMTANKQRFEAISEAFGAIKEIKAASLEANYIKRFKEPALIFAKHRAIARFVAILPRYLLEAVVFGGLIIVTLNIIGRGETITSTIPLLTLYAFAGYRLLPAFQQIFISLSSLSFVKPALMELRKEILSLVEPKDLKICASKIPFEQSIDLKNVSYQYPNSKNLAVDNLKLTIPKYSFFGFVGPTGGGKTTIIDLLLGLLTPNKGTLEIDNIPIIQNNSQGWQNNIGYVPQDVFLSDTSIAENIAFGSFSEDINMNLVEEVSKIANIHNFIITNLPNGYKSEVGEKGVRLSGGQKQRIGIARALYRKPKVLILDEATSALDNSTERSVMKSIKKFDNEMTIIVIAHRLNTIKNCDQVAFIEQGKLLAIGNYDELFKTNIAFRELVKAASNNRDNTL